LKKKSVKGALDEKEKNDKSKTKQPASKKPKTEEKDTKQKKETKKQDSKTKQTVATPKVPPTPQPQQDPQMTQITKLPSGLQYQEVKIWNGPVVKEGQNLKVRYKGLLQDGHEFGTNMPRGKTLIVCFWGVVALYKAGILGCKECVLEVVEIY